MESPQEQMVTDSKSHLYALLPASFLVGLMLFFTFSISSQGSNQRLQELSIGGTEKQHVEEIDQSKRLQKLPSMGTEKQHVEKIDQCKGLQKLPSGGTEKQNVEKIDQCKNQCRPTGSEALPAGIVSNTSSFEMKHLWEIPKKEHRHTVDVKENTTTNLFAMAVGIKQKDLVDKMVQKFIACNFMVMLFHYDGIVDEWKDFKWSNHVIHVAAINQGKWWFAKRFLHPDIVAEYDYIFLWDEDLGVENFHPDKYVSIIKNEGLEISQPALDTQNSVVHHQITARGRRSTVHRRTYKRAHGGKGCDESSTAPPCTGWIEMMAPVFSRSAWRCVWYMIQSDLVHAWGLDMQLGYCAQGDRTKNVGVVDAEYIVHHNRPTLGGIDKTKVTSKEKDHRVDVRRLSYWELDVFRKRWKKAAEEDKCWVDPYQQPLQE